MTWFTTPSGIIVPDMDKNEELVYLYAPWEELELTVYVNGQFTATFKCAEKKSTLIERIITLVSAANKYSSLFSKDEYTILNAEDILREQLYGLSEVKQCHIWNETYKVDIFLGVDSWHDKF